MLRVCVHVCACTHKYACMYLNIVEMENKSGVYRGSEWVEEGAECYKRAAWWVFFKWSCSLSWLLWWLYKFTRDKIVSNQTMNDVVQSWWGLYKICVLFSVKFLIVESYHSYARCNFWEKLGEKYMGSLLFLTPACDLAFISKQKVGFLKSNHVETSPNPSSDEWISFLKVEY